MDAVEYVKELLAELEINNETDRMDELTAIKISVKDAVKKNEYEIKAEMQKIIDAANLVGAEGSEVSQQSNGATGSLETVHTGITRTSSVPQSHSDIEAKLRLRHTYIEEDADEINTLLVSIKKLFTS